MLHIVHPQGHANKTTTGYHYTPIRMAEIQTRTTPSADKGVERQELSFIAAGGSAKW